MRELLFGYAEAVEEGTGPAGPDAPDGPARRPGELRRDLEAVAAALVRHDELRRVLTDPGIPATTRRAVVRDLLEAKALPAAVNLLSYAIAVERAPELPVVLSQLIVKLGDDEQRRAEPEVAARAAGVERLRGFAERVLQELPGTAEVDDVEDELFRLARILDGHPELRAVLSDVQAPLAGRLAVLDDLLASKVRTETLRLARYVLAAGQQRDLVGAFERLAAFAAEERGRRLAEVRSAVDLDDAEVARLAAALGRVVDRPVEVRVIRDPSVIGGAFVTVGDLVIDGTVRLRLDRLRDALAPSS